MASELAEQDVATNRRPAASRKLHEDSIVNLEIGARPQAACGSTLAFCVMHSKVSKAQILESIFQTRTNNLI